MHRQYVFHLRNTNAPKLYCRHRSYICLQKYSDFNTPRSLQNFVLHFFHSFKLLCATFVFVFTILRTTLLHFFILRTVNTYIIILANYRNLVIRRRRRRRPLRYEKKKRELAGNPLARPLWYNKCQRKKKLKKKGRECKRTYCRQLPASFEYSPPKTTSSLTLDIQSSSCLIHASYQI